MHRSADSCSPMSLLKRLLDRLLACPRVRHPKSKEIGCDLVPGVDMAQSYMVACDHQCCLDGKVFARPSWLCGNPFSQFTHKAWRTPYIDKGYVKRVILAFLILNRLKGYRTLIPALFCIINQCADCHRSCGFTNMMPLLLQLLTARVFLTLARPLVPQLKRRSTACMMQGHANPDPFFTTGICIAKLQVQI